MWRDFPRLQIDVAELDPRSRGRASRGRFFEPLSSPRLDVAAQDGCRYLDDHDEQWDVIVIDAHFDADSIPFHLTTNEFLELARSRLAPGGVIVANVIGAMEGPNSRLFRSFYRTYGTVFRRCSSIRSVHKDRNDSVLNLILVATDRPPPARPFLAERWRSMREEIHASRISPRRSGTAGRGPSKRGRAERPTTT